MDEDMMTPEEECLAGGGLVYEDGMCKSREDIEQEAVDKDAADKKAEADAAAMVATALKLHKGIGKPGGAGADLRGASYGSDANAANIAVSIGGNPFVHLSKDDEATVAGLSGWTGMRFTAEPTDDGVYEAVVYSYVGEPKEGAKFNSGTDGIGFVLDTGSEDTVTLTADLNVGSRIASPRFTHAAGDHTFKLPENNPTGQTMIPVSGSYYGVAGTYSCTPGTGACTVRKAAEGYTFVNPAAWTFKATNPEARALETPDADYASYGWWLHKSEDDSTYTASAFHAYRGTDSGTVGIADLSGTATYTGGAAGKYALHSTTGGTNDAGHFTADAMLKATFGAEHMVTGTVDNFVGTDGEARDWSVALNKSTVDDAGAIGNQMTVWTIGGTDAEPAGEWSGNLREQDGNTGIPGVATGTFYSEFGRDGKMVGAFGTNVE
ncbi:MAG: hypothetical protein OXH79_18260 [Boseongicola sp.]|nr:hypothetical protein [Boseongicola sp.]